MWIQSVYLQRFEWESRFRESSEELHFFRVSHLSAWEFPFWEVHFKKSFPFWDFFYSESFPLERSTFESLSLLFWRASLRRVSWVSGDFSVSRLSSGPSSEHFLSDKILSGTLFTQSVSLSMPLVIYRRIAAAYVGVGKSHLGNYFKSEIVWWSQSNHTLLFMLNKPPENIVSHRSNFYRGL